MSDTAFEQAVKAVRFLSADAIEQAKSGHPGAPMALAAIGVDLYSRYLRYVPEDPSWPNRDRFVLSCGHASMLLYSLLHLAGYALSLEDLQQFRQWGSKTPGHPEVGHTPGVETTTGPLGQGLGNAVGLALASKLMGARVGPELIDYRVYALCSDGDLMEGVASEAASLAGHLGLDNLVVVYDDNSITIDGSTALSFTEDVCARFASYGWSVERVDGHDPEAFRAAMDRALAVQGRPSFIAARTRIGFGAPTKENSPKAHGAPLGAQELEGAKRAAGWPLTPFYVPEEARAPFTGWQAEQRARYEQWQARFAAATPEVRAWLAGPAAPADLLEQLLAAAPPAKDATRSLAAKVEQRAAALLPALIGGSADLAESCKTTLQGGGDVAAGQWAGRNLHFGIREHGMGAILNGLALSGFFLPFGSTFLIFSDYLRPALRLAALMKQQVVYVFTHDSVYVGEDGPTHQPIEQLASLRLIPNVDVVRPADAVECAVAWTYALQRREGPTALALSRQNLPPIERPASFQPADALAGAYVVADAEDATHTLIASGSEVHVALQVQRLLAAEGWRLRVVSAPCWSAFERLPRERQAAVLGSGRLVSLEAGVTSAWRGVVGRDGLCLGIDRFGASAPGERVAQELGLTAEAVARALRASR